MTQKIALFPGSFDPFTAGHEAIVRRAMALFDRIIIAVGMNTDKQYMFSMQERMDIIVGAQFILRGIRDAKDLEYEQTIAAVNKTLSPDIETVLLLADDQHRDISSTLVREQLEHQQKSQ